MSAPTEQPAPTPRTDAEAVLVAGPSDLKDKCGVYVPVWFARTLERELLTAQATIQALRDHGYALVQERDDARRELDRYTQAYDIACDERTIMKNKISEDRERLDWLDTHISQWKAEQPKS